MSRRKAHVKRVYAVDEDGDIDVTKFIDVLRIDRITMGRRGSPLGTTGVDETFRFKWLDGPDDPGGDAQHENANKKRKTKQLKIENPSDSSAFVNLWIILRQHVRFPNAHWDVFRDWSSWFFQTVFNNVPADGSESPPPPAHRRVDRVRVPHNDLGGLDMTSPVDWDDVYLPALKAGGVDPGQYVDVEYVELFHLRTGQMPDGRGNYQADAYRLKNDSIAKQIDVSGADPSKSYRLDPLQMIVNVGWDIDEISIIIDVQWMWVLNALVNPDTVVSIVVSGQAQSPPAGYVLGGVTFPQVHVVGLPYANSGLDVFSPVEPRPNFTTASPALSGSIQWPAGNYVPPHSPDYYPDRFDVPIDFSTATLTDPKGNVWTPIDMLVLPAVTQGDGAITIDDPDTVFPRPFNSGAWVAGDTEEVVYPDATAIAGFRITFKKPPTP